MFKLELLYGGDISVSNRLKDITAIPMLRKAASKCSAQAVSVSCECDTNRTNCYCSAVLCRAKKHSTDVEQTSQARDHQAPAIIGGVQFNQPIL